MERRSRKQVRITGRSLVAAPCAWSTADASAHPVGPGLPDLVWNFDPWIVGPLIACGVLYSAGIAGLWRRAGVGRGISGIAALHFTLGWSFLWLALVSPLDAFGSRSLWGADGSARTPDGAGRAAARARSAVGGVDLGDAAAGASAVGSIGAIGVAVLGLARVASPLVAGLVHAAAVWVWHAPALFQRALVDETAHTVQHISFLFSALLFWGGGLSSSGDVSGLWSGRDAVAELARAHGDARCAHDLLQPAVVPPGCRAGLRNGLGLRSTINTSPG